MAARPEVSVIIPTRGRPELLRRAVESALGQKAVDIEVIVVVDGDDGVSYEAVQAMGEARVRCIVLSDAVGGSEARNVGARESKGELVALLDDDDEWLPEKLTRQMELARRATGTAFVVTTRYLYRKAGSEDEVWPGYVPGPGDDLSEFLFSSCGGFQTSTYLCPRALLMRVPFKKGLKKHQDWDWFLRLVKEPRFELLVVEEPLSVYWVPLGVRASVSAKVDWRFSLEWVESMRGYVTAKAYAAFVARICLRGAAIQGESVGTLVGLMSRIVRSGAVTVPVLLQCGAALVLPERFRERLRGLRHRETLAMPQRRGAGARG